MTKKLTRNQKTRAAFGRAFVTAGMSPRAASRIMRANWRNVVMPWRMIPNSIVLALIALVALAMVLDIGEEPVSPTMSAPDAVVCVAEQEAEQEAEPTEQAPAMPRATP